MWATCIKFCQDLSSLLSVAIISTLMLFDRLCSLMGGINKRKRLEWAIGRKEAESGMDVGHLLKWKRKWAIIHNSASLKTSIRWSLSSLLLIARNSLHLLETFVVKATGFQIFFKDCSFFPDVATKDMLNHTAHVHTSYFSLHLGTCFINAWSCHLILDMRELSVYMEGYSKYLGIPEDLKVRNGDDVELKCSASSSEEPNYYWQKEVRELWVHTHSSRVLNMLLETCQPLPSTHL